MLYAIQFDDQIDFGTVEIDDVVANHILTPKLDRMHTKKIIP